MANLVKFNPQMMKEWKKQGKESLFFFSRGICGNSLLNAGIHKELLDFLQGPSKRKLVCGWRGSLKSTCFIYYFWWMGLYFYKNVLLVEQKWDNAKAHHERLQQVFLMGDHAGLLQDMFSDRIDSNTFRSTERTVLIRKNPMDEPFITLGSLEGKLESVHRDIICGDDLEGADADESNIPNEASEKFVYERMEPLFRNPSESVGLIGGTPHGGNPLVHKLIKDPQWASWWKEVVDESGKSRWPEYFSEEWIKNKRRAAELSSKARRMWDMQYMLRKGSYGDSIFDLEKIKDNLYTIDGGRILRYYRSDHSLVDENYETTKSVAHIDYRACRFYIHGDPQHRGPDERKGGGKRPSKSAWIVVAVGPDFHCFVVEVWVKDCGLDEYIEGFFHLYRKWAPYRWTFEQIGAQKWLLNHIRVLETTKFQKMRSHVRPWRPPSELPRPSRRCITIPERRSDKEQEIVQQLEIPFNVGWLHLHESQEELLHQIQVFPGSDEQIDALDALSQGPQVWKPPMSPAARLAIHRREMEMRRLSATDPAVYYETPWKETA